MVINVSEIRRGKGLSMQTLIADAGPVEGLELRSPLKVDLKLTNVGSGILLAGILDTVVNLVCSRCAADYAEHMVVSVSELFVPEGTPEAQSGEECAADELCVFTYKDNVIELDEVLRQNLIASIPFRPLCKEECQGLCSQCGANLNEESCKCEVLPEKDSRWQVLDKFRTGSPHESR